MRHAAALATLLFVAGCTTSPPPLSESMEATVTEPSASGAVTNACVVETTDPADTDPPVFRRVLTVAAGPLSIASGRRLQVNLFDTANGVLAILVGGSVAEWDRTLEMSLPVLDSVTIGE